MKAAIIGGGVIGAGWVARFVLNGWDVCVNDPHPDTLRATGEVLDNARRSLPSLYDHALPVEGALKFTHDLDDALADADWVQESIPERLPIKQAVLGQLCAAAPSSAIIASSTSGFKPSELNADGARAIVAHPFNPVYLLPLVELVGDTDTCARAAELLRGLGMFPLTLRQEIDAHIADRLLEAVWRESLWMIKDGIATTGEIDDAIRLGFGLRWAQMGLFETYRIAGGEVGMRHFLAQFGPCLSSPWTRLTDVPELTDELVELIAGQSDAQSGHRTVRELERQRDDNLVGILRSLRQTHADEGPGRVVAAHDRHLLAQAMTTTSSKASAHREVNVPREVKSSPSAPDISSERAPESRINTLPLTLQRQVPITWTDYNGHMNEARYLEAGSQATDNCLLRIGADAAYVAKGFSYFTVETHVIHLSETHAGDTLEARSQLLVGQGRKLHLFHQLYRGDGTLVATVETLLLHMDLTARRSCEPNGTLIERIKRWAATDTSLPVPEGAGRFVGQPR